VTSSEPGPAIEALHFDGRSTRATRVRLASEAGELVATPLDAAHSGTPPAPRRWPLADVRWPERTRHGRRVAHLADGGQLDFEDAAAFDAWQRALGAGESWVVRAQQQWRTTLGAVVLLAGVLVAGYWWGVPWAARGIVALVPHEVDRSIGEAALTRLQSQLLLPSKLGAERQEALRRSFAAALASRVPLPRQRPWQVRFHSGGKVLGANAFALPDGSIVFTDELLALLEGHDDALVGVFGHEYGHLHHRHGMQALARFTLVSLATSVALGDFSTVLAGAPALLAHLSYSRDAERQADRMAAEVLVASGRSPQAMVTFFERMAAKRGTRGPGERALPIALASHPEDEERVDFFREYGRAR
jgi:Zn-dependent protease with chaperone function